MALKKNGGRGFPLNLVLKVVVIDFSTSPEKIEADIAQQVPDGSHLPTGKRMQYLVMTKSRTGTQATGVHIDQCRTAAAIRGTRVMGVPRKSGNF